MTPADARNRWQKHRAEAGALPADIRIAVAGSMTAEPLEPYLGDYLLRRAFRNPRVSFGPFGQIPQICRDYKSFFTEDTDAIVLLWRLEDMFAAALEDPAALLEALDAFAAAVRDLRENFAGTVIVSIPPYPSTAAFDPSSLDQPAFGAALHARAVERWISRMQQISRIKLLDLGALERKLGTDAAQDPRKWFLYRQPWTEAFWHAAGRQLGRIVAAETRSAKKCIVLDADNTLWGGIIGEDGMEGIALGEDFPGSAYRAFQKHLLHLKNKGVLLAVASRNNEADFFEVLDTHDAMVLKRGDFAAFQVHWKAKVDSIRTIAKTLNIGTDAMVFIDDSAKELAEVQERLPEVVCLHAPGDAADLANLLVGSDLFDLAEVTEEDKKRTGMIIAETARRELQDTVSEEDFKASLGLEMTVFAAQKQHIARVAQLINKTNQFNLTTRRRRQDEVEKLAGDPRCRVIGMELKDKYGDYGLVGVAILEKKETTCVIDTLLMSCRALGRDAETAFIGVLAEQAAALGCKTIEGCYIPTAKNAVVKGFYQKHGMTFDAARDVWTMPSTATADLPAHIRVTRIFGDAP